MIASCLVHVLLQATGAPRDAQDAPPSWVPQVDALFAEWDRPGSPGCALGVIQDGKLVHARGFGEASLELSVPITPATVFDIGSTSKQFTAACIGLLVQDGKLEVDDEVHEWIQELAYWDSDVTLDHMLHHTSGIPDYIGFLARRGKNTADWTTPADALAALAEVQQLAFEPGTRFEYSNSNYFLLSLVIERAAGMPFPEFAQKRIFEPLHMGSTLLLHDHTLVVPRRATGYVPRGGGFAVEMSDWEQLGDGAVQTSVVDLAKWDANFYSKAVGGQELFAFLHGRVPLADGKPSSYARGLMVDAFRGLGRVGHGGAWAGFRAQLVRFPVQRTSIVCLANLASMDPTALCESVAAIVLSTEMEVAK